MAGKKVERSTDIFGVCMDCKHPLTETNDPVKTVTINDPEALGFPVSHGLCNEDLVKRKAELDRYRADRAKSKNT